MAYYSLGLFPFFQYASPSIKPVIITLIYESFLQLKSELIPSVTGLLVSILPGLDEQNEDL